MAYMYDRRHRELAAEADRLSRVPVVRIEGQLAGECEGSTRRATSVPERAENCGHEQSLTDTGNVL